MDDEPNQWAERLPLALVFRVTADDQVGKHFCELPNCSYAKEDDSENPDSTPAG